MANTKDNERNTDQPIDSKGTEPHRKTKGKTLSPKVKDFIRRYIDKDSDTYSNATRSYMKAYDTKETSAQAESSRVLMKPHVQSYMMQLAEETGITDKVAMGRLADIVNGITKEVVTTHRGRDGETTGTSTVVSTPSARDSIAAIELRNKMVGLYSQQEIDKAVTMDRYHERKRKMIRELTAGANALDSE